MPRASNSATTSVASTDPAPSAVKRRPRADGLEARQQLLLAGLRLFSEKGFARTSLRDLAKAADCNIAAISYYFGDKDGLYRAVFTEPLGKPSDDIGRYLPSHLSLRESLQGFMSGFLAPLKAGELSRQAMRLHFREMVEPTGRWAEQIDTDIRPAHAALTEVLRRHLGAPKADDDVHRLAFSITGLAVQMFISRDVIDALRPKLIASPSAIDAWTEQLVSFAEAMVQVEQKRRAAAASAPEIPTKSSKKTRATHDV